MYHSICSPKNSEEFKNYLYEHISIEEDLFEQQILYLKKRGHTFISFKDLATADIRNIYKPTIIYFDDGFKNLLTNAAPILHKYGIPATIFLITGILDHTHMLWTIQYKHASHEGGIAKDEQNYQIENIKNKTDRKRIEVMRQFPIDKHSPLFHIFLSWNDVALLVKNNFELGSHSVSHARLTECSPQELQFEIVHSKRRIEEETGQKVDSFSFPHSRGSEQLIGELGKYGYRFGVSAGKGLNNMPISNHMMHYLKNISPKPGESLWMFALRIYFLNIKT
mgnify:FL=1